MRLENALAAKLADVLGADIGSRVFPDGIPQEVSGETCVVYARVSEDSLFLLNGGRDTTEVDFFQLEAWGVDRDDVADVRDTLRAAFQGADAGGRWGGDSGILVWGAVASDAAADSESPIAGSESLDVAERLTLKITWERGA